MCDNDFDKYHRCECYICGNLTDVRYKNIYLTNSKGINICWSCEKNLLVYIRKQRQCFIFNKLNILKIKADRKKVKK